jgi:hypothetical protein
MIFFENWNKDWCNDFLEDLRKWDSFKDFQTKPKRSKNRKRVTHKDDFLLILLTGRNRVPRIYRYKSAPRANDLDAPEAGKSENKDRERSRKRRPWPSESKKSSEKLRRSLSGRDRIDFIPI